MAHLKQMRLPKDIDFVHSHSSPPCTWTFPGVTVNLKKNRVAHETARVGALLLSLSRQVHDIMSKRKFVSQADGANDDENKEEEIDSYRVT